MLSYDSEDLAGGYTPKNLKELFMPDGLCARCNEREAKVSKKFIYKPQKGPHFELILGFCDALCFVQFEQGIEGANDAH